MNTLLKTQKQRFSLSPLCAHITCACLILAGCNSIDPDSILYTCSLDSQDPCGSGYFCGPDLVCHPLGFDSFDTTTDSTTDTTTTTDTSPDASNPCDLCSQDQICFESECLGISQLALGSTHSCARFSNGHVACWGNNAQYQTAPSALTTDPITRPQRVNLEGGTALKLCAGDTHTCAIVRDAQSTIQVRCWGDNSLGQLGIANTAPTNLHTFASLGAGVVDLACGASHTCALITEGSSTNQVRCWGDNRAYQAGHSDTSSSTPSSPSDLTTLIPSTDNIEAIAAGRDHTCLLHNQGQSMTCWGGDNALGQLGARSLPPSSPETIDISTLSANLISAGASNTCLVDDQGAARCLGGNTLGQLGYGSGPTTTRDTPSNPVQISTGSSLGKVITIASGSDFSCAIVENATAQRKAFCWGSNSAQQLAQPNSTASSNRAIQISDFTNVAQIATGGAHACIVQLNTSDVICWGANDSGQLGDGTTASSSQPKSIF